MSSTAETSGSKTGMSDISNETDNSASARWKSVSASVMTGNATNIITNISRASEVPSISISKPIEDIDCSEENVLLEKETIHTHLDHDNSFMISPQKSSEDMTKIPIYCSKRMYTMKVLILGDVGTGKTSLVKRIVSNEFTPNYKATIGLDFYSKTIERKDCVVNLRLFDLAGQDRTIVFCRAFYASTDGGFIVYDVSRPETIKTAQEWVEKWKSSVLRPDGIPAPYIILGNKCDLKGKKKDIRSKENNLEKGFLISVKENINVETALNSLVDKMLKARLFTEEEDDEEVISLNKKNKKSKCMC